MSGGWQNPTMTILSLGDARRRSIWRKRCVREMFERKRCHLRRSRRDFVKAGLGRAPLQHDSGQDGTRRPLQVPLGLQLYSVRNFCPRTTRARSKQIGAIGFREVESAGYYNHTAAQVKQAMSAAGLHLVSAHYSL